MRSFFFIFEVNLQLKKDLRHSSTLLHALYLTVEEEQYEMGGEYCQATNVLVSIATITPPN